MKIISSLVLNFSGGFVLCDFFFFFLVLKIFIEV